MQSSINRLANEPEHIAISKSTGIKIDWKDGHHSDYALAYLRDECPCATCTGAHGTEPQKSNYPSRNCSRCTSRRCEWIPSKPVGSYAIRIDWNDGHSTGIYSFDHLTEDLPLPGMQGATGRRELKRKRVSKAAGS